MPGWLFISQPKIISNLSDLFDSRMCYRDAVEVPSSDCQNYSPTFILESDHDQHDCDLLSLSKIVNSPEHIDHRICYHLPADSWTSPSLPHSIDFRTKTICGDRPARVATYCWTRSPSWRPGGSATSVYFYDIQTGQFQTTGNLISYIRLIEFPRSLESINFQHLLVKINLLLLMPCSTEKPYVKFIFLTQHGY